jgi:hypothetical protein
MVKAMAIGNIETALYDITTRRAVRKQFVEARTDALKSYGLSADEANEIADIAVAELVGRGVNPMLTMGLWVCINGPASLPDYLAAMRSAFPETGKRDQNG